MLTPYWKIKGPGDFDPPEPDPDPLDEFDERYWSSSKFWKEVYRLDLDLEPVAHVEEDIDGTSLSFTVILTVFDSETVTLEEDDAKELAPFLAEIPTTWKEDVVSDEESTPLTRALEKAGKPYEEWDA